MTPDRPLPGRSKAMPVLLGAAATALALILAVAVGQSVGARRDEPGAVASPGATVSAPPSATALAAPTASLIVATATSDPSVMPHLRPLVQSWRPATTTLLAIVHENTRRPAGGTQGGDLTLVDVPTDGRPSTRILTAPLANGLDISADGRFVVVAARIDDNTSRLALWDAWTNASRWLAPAEPGAILRNPILSADATFVYFGKAKGEADLGLFRARVSDGQVSAVRAPVQRPLFSVPQRHVVDDTLFWGRAYEGASLEALRPSGEERSFGECAFFQSWRPDAPRVLVVTGLCGTGARGGDLYLWDEASGSKIKLIDRAAELAVGADWDPEGKRIVAAVRAGAGGDAPAALVTTDARGDDRKTLVGTEHSGPPLWLRAGIAYAYAQADASGFGTKPPYEVRIVQPDGSGLRILFSASDPIVWLRFVTGSR